MEFLDNSRENLGLDEEWCSFLRSFIRDAQTNAISPRSIDVTDPVEVAMLTANTEAENDELYFEKILEKQIKAGELIRKALLAKKWSTATIIKVRFGWDDTYLSQLISSGRLVCYTDHGSILVPEFQFTGNKNVAEQISYTSSLMDLSYPSVASTIEWFKPRRALGLMSIAESLVVDSTSAYEANAMRASKDT